jgi:ribosomal protein L15E
MIQSLDARQDLGYKEGKGIVLIQKIQRLKDRKAKRLMASF